MVVTQLSQHSMATAVRHRLRGSEGPAIRTPQGRLDWQAIAKQAAHLDEALSNAQISTGATLALPGRNNLATATLCLGLVASARCAQILNPFQPAEPMIESAREMQPDAWLVDEAMLDEASFGAEDNIFVYSASGSVRRHRSARGRTAVSTGLDCGLILSTSGTTGHPKRVALSDITLTRSIDDIVAFNTGFGDRRRSDGRWPPLIQYSPLAHIGGALTLLRAAVQGRETVLLEKFDPHHWAEIVASERLITTGLPPAMMRMVLDAEISQDALLSLNSVWSGSAPVTRETAGCFTSRYGLPVLGNYGATEFCGAIATWSLDDHRRYYPDRSDAVGRIDPGVAQARIRCPETNEILPIGKTGLLEVRVARVGEDWISTNDLAHLDGDAFLYLHGRADDAIVRGGFKLSPEIIAAALRHHPEVRDAAVVGIDDVRLGQVPVAAVEISGKNNLGADDLIAFVRQKLPVYFAPVTVRFVDSLPRTPAMKIDRPAIRRLFES